MVRKGECAFLCNGQCLFCHGECSVAHDEMVCRDAVRKAAHHDIRPRRSIRNLTARFSKYRYERATEGVRGFELYASCKSKFRYKTEFAANKAAKEKERKYGVAQRAYFCRFCGGYHLTTKRARRLELPSAVMECAA